MKSGPLGQAQVATATSEFGLESIVFVFLSSVLRASGALGVCPSLIHFELQIGSVAAQFSS